MLATWRIRQCTHVIKRNSWEHNYAQQTLMLCIAWRHCSSACDHSQFNNENVVLKEKIIVRIQIYENQSSSKNKEQTQESISQMRIWVYKNLYRRFSEFLSLSRIQAHYNLWCFIDNKNSSHIQSSRDFAWVTCNFACLINDAWA